MADEHQFAERRATHDSSIDKLVLYRLDIMEKNVELFNTKQNSMILEITTLKSELQHTAEKSAKWSGTLSGIATGIIMGIIMMLVQSLKV